MKKITTFLLALLLTIPAMAVTFNSGDVIYLNAGGSGLWDQGGAKFSAAFDDADFASEFGKKTDEGYYIFTVPGTGKSYEGVRFVRNTNAATSPGWDPKWNETNKITAIEGKNLYTITGWGGADGSWSTYTPTVADELVIPDGLFSYNEGEIAVFFVNTKSWTKINAHVWGDAGDYTSWPGEAMTQVDEKVNNKYNCYKWVYDGAKTAIPGGLIIMNANNTNDRAGGGDLTFTNGGVYDGNGKLLTTITPTPVVEPTITLSYSPETIYVGDVVTFSSTVQNGEGYTVKYYVDGVENGETWTPTAAGEYTIAANLMNGSDVVAFDEKVVTVKEHSTLTFTVEVPTGTENVNIAGTFNGWSASQTPMNQVGLSNVFTVTLNDVDKETVQYKYVTNQSWDNVEVTAENSNVDNRSYSENDVVAKWKDIDLEGAEPTLFIRGTMNSWGATEMEYDADAEVFTWTGDLDVNAQFKFAKTADSWDFGYDNMTYNGEIDITRSDDGNFVWGGVASNVTMTVDKGYTTLTIVVNSTVAPVVPEALYIVGSMLNEWGEFVAMEKVENVFSWTGDLKNADEFKFTIVDNWDGGKYVYEGSVNVDAEGYALVDGSGKGNSVWGGANANVTITVDFSGAAPLMKVVYNSVEATIFSYDHFYLLPGFWDVDGAWYAARFHNAFTDAEVWVKGTLVTGEGEGDYAGQTITYYEFEVPMPTVALVAEGEDEVQLAEYTHVIFTRMNPASEDMTWDNMWNQTSNLYVTAELPTNIYEIPATAVDGASWNEIGDWKEENIYPTAVEAVEADGMVYAGNVVTAEGAIEVYNLSGAVVAYGENRVDLNGLACGVYVVRCGNGVMKVVR